MNAMLFFVMLLSAQAANDDTGSMGSYGSYTDTGSGGSYTDTGSGGSYTDPDEKDEADCDRSGQAAYAPGDCVLNGSPDKTNCNGADFNLDLYVKGTDGTYTTHTKGCVIGNNLNWMSESDTVETCQAKCDLQDDCLAIEFGVAYGGLKKGTKSTGDCTKDASTPTKPPTEASTDAPKRSKPVHDADAAVEALKAYTVVTDISSVTLTPTKAPTSPAPKEGQYLKTETTTVDAVEAKMKIALTAAEAENKAVIQSLEHGVADAIGAKKANVKVDAIDGNKLSRRRLAEVEITFIIIAENAADIAQLQTDIVAAGAEGSIVANIQKHAAANGVLTAELKAMNPKVTIAAPTTTTTTVTVVTVETGTDPNAPTKAPTKEKDEADCDRSGQAAYAPGDCVLNGSPDKTNCNGTDFNLDLYVKGTDGKYTAHTEGCVIGNNLNWMSESDTVESCQAKCDKQDDCKAIEFGVAYGGLKKGTKSTGDCTKAPTDADTGSYTPSTEAPATDTPATETPATETPATDTPATDTPATETPATDTPATDTPKDTPRKKPEHDAAQAAKDLATYTVVVSFAGVTLPPTKAPTAAPVPEGSYAKTEEVEKEAVSFPVTFPVSGDELTASQALQTSMETGMAAALGTKKENCKIGAVDGKKLSSRRRLAENAVVTFIIIVENAAAVAAMKNDVVAAGKEGSIVANIQKAAAANGVLTAGLKAMEPSVTIAPPTETTVKVTVVTIVKGTAPPTKAPTKDETLNGAGAVGISHLCMMVAIVQAITFALM